MLRVTRLRRVLVALVVVGVIIASTVACGGVKNHCKPGTATFPISGTVVKKESPEKDCYVLHVRRDNSVSVETVHVSRYRYLHTEARSSVSYSSQPK